MSCFRATPSVCFFLAFLRSPITIRYDRGMNVRYVLIYVQDCRNGIFFAEGAMKPLQIVITPLVKSSLVLYFHHILMCTRKHDSNHPHLVRSYLTFLIPAVRIRWLISSIWLDTSLGSFTSLRLRWVCVGSAFLAMPTLCKENTY